MKKRTWTLILCALMVLGALFFGCDQPSASVEDNPALDDTPELDDTPSGGGQTQDDEEEPPVFPELKSFPISSSGGTKNSVTLLLKTDGTVWATGYNRYGQFGNGTTIPSPYITNSFTQVAQDVIAVADSTSDTFIIKADGNLWAAGRNSNDSHTSETTTFEKEEGLPSGIKVKAVSVSAGILVLLENGELWVKGKNDNGQLGTGNTTTVTQWTKVTGDVKAIAKSAYYSLILKTDGKVYAVGAKGPTIGLGSSGQGNQLSFAQVFEDAVAIAISSDHSLILKNNGTIWGAGITGWGRLGDGTIVGNGPQIGTYTQIKDSNGNAITDVSAISAGGSHSLILKNDGSVWGTGDLYFDFNDGNNATNIGWFTKMAEGVKAISAQGDQSFIVKNDGSLWVAGNVNVGILGNANQQTTTVFTQITMPQ
jgi:alpha-tubulin suppressor-like RCC1 family protein